MKVAFNSLLKSSRVFLVVSGLIWLIQYGFLICLMSRNWIDYMNSDVASDLTLAKTIAGEGRFILTKNWWSSTELHLLHTQILQSILFRFTSDYHVVFVISFAIFAILVMFLMGGVAHAATDRLELFFVPAIMSFTPIGEYWEFLYRSQSYVTYIFFTYLFLLMYVYASYGKEIKGTKAYITKIGVLVLAMLMGTCGVRFFLQVIGPFLFAKGLIFVFYHSEEEQQSCGLRFKEILFDFGVLISSACGYLVYSYVLKKAYSTGDYGNVSWVGVSTIKENIYHFPVGLLEIFGGTRAAGEKLFSREGIVQGILIVSVFLIITIAFGYSIKSVVAAVNNTPIEVSDEKEYFFRQRFLSLFSVFSILLMLFLLTFTSMGQIWGRPLESHYLALSMCTIPIVFTVAISKMNVTTSAMVMISALFLARMIGSDMVVYEPEKTEIPQYAQYLNDSGMTFGYADDYWKAGIMMAWTNDKVQVVQVENPVAEILVVHEFANRREYKDKVPEFLILTNKNGVQPSDLRIDATEVYKDDDVTIVKIFE